MGKYLLGFLLGTTLLFANTESLFAQDYQSRRTLVYQSALHFAISTELSFASCMFLTLKDPEMPLAKKYLLGSGVAVFIGFAKEFSDLIDGYFDWNDIGFDMLGVGTGIVLHYFIFDRKMRHNSVSLNLSKDCYMASVKIYF